MNAIATPTLTPAPGQFWPEQDAHYAGIVCMPDGTSWHLLLPKDHELPQQAWGKYGQDVAGAKCHFDGHANTIAMAEAGSPLAQAIQALPGDCYLPSRVEAIVLFATLRDQLNPEGWHWTSTQYGPSLAFVQAFEDGYSYWNLKGITCRVRAVRRIPTSTLQTVSPSSATEGSASRDVGEAVQTQIEAVAA